MITTGQRLVRRSCTRVFKPSIKVATSLRSLRSAKPTCTASSRSTTRCCTKQRRVCLRFTAHPSPVPFRPVTPRSCIAYNHTMSIHDSRDASTVTPVKSVQDKRDYRFFTLPNQLDVLLVSDEETDKSAAAMDVRVGHFSDPDELPGLAHFLEHMLFLGTAKYPSENEYNEYLNSHGGSSNAYTSTENTNYYFDVTHPHLEGALDRFAQFFVAPLFTASATDREIQAVNNENSKNLQNDMWRSFQFLKSTSRKEHPFSKFGTGNAQTLREEPAKKGVDTRKALLQFHEQYYSSNQMKLVVIGRESLDTLQKWVTERFSEVKNTRREAPSFPGTPFGPEQLQKTFRIVPVKDMRTLDLLWPMPPTYEHYKIKPTNLLAHLLGHEGKGSLLSLLKKQGWANGLNAGSSQSAYGFSLFAVSLDLTVEGLQHTEDIVAALFEYVQCIHNASDEELHQAFIEERDISAMNFRFKGKERPFNYSSSLASAMHLYAPEEVLSGPWLYQHFDKRVVRDFFSRVTPQNLRIHITSKSFEGQTTDVEPWYHTEYASEQFSDDFIKRLSAAGKNPLLHLPPPNEFIATDFTLKGHERTSDDQKETFPQLLTSAGGSKLWHKLDDVFGKPMANVVCNITTPTSYATPMMAMLTDMYTRLVEDDLNEFSYDAALAGLTYSLTPSATGIKLSFGGYSHKLPVLVEQTVQRMRSLKVSRERFYLILEKVVRDLKNFEKEQPYQHAMYDQMIAFEYGRWHYKEKLAMVSELSESLVQEHMERLFRQTSVEVLMHGNMDSKDAEQLNATLRNNLVAKPLPLSQVPDMRLVCLPAARCFYSLANVENKEEQNSALHMYFQIGENDVATRARCNVLAHLMTEPCFNQLRTNEQLGYLVHSSLTVQRGVIGLRLIIQSSEHAADYLDSRAEAFLDSFQGFLKTISEEAFASNVEALSVQLMEKDKKLSDETTRYWAEINVHRYDFGRRHKMLKVLQSLSKEDVLEFFMSRIAINAPNRRKFSSLVFGGQWPLPGSIQVAHPKAPKAKDSSEPADEQHPTAELVPAPENKQAQEVMVNLDYSKFQRSMQLYPNFI